MPGSRADLDFASARVRRRVIASQVDPDGAYARAMDAFVMVYRLIAVIIVIVWVGHIAKAARQPPDWEPAWAQTLPVRLTRNRSILVGMLGIIAGLAVFVVSFVLFP
jgi:hypothetical protein